jgi:hypothetical protein
MTLIRTSPSGPTVEGGDLPPGDYDGEPFVWNGVEWGPQSTIRVSAIQAVTPAASVQIDVCDSVLILPTGDFTVQASGSANLLAMSVVGTNIVGPSVILNDTTAVNFLRLSSSQWEGAGDFVSLSSVSGSGVSFEASGAELGCGTGQSVRLAINGVIRFQIDDTGIGFFNVTPVAQQSITGVTEQEQIDSIVAALVNLGLVTDDRLP